MLNTIKMTIKKINWYYLFLWLIFLCGLVLRAKGLLSNSSFWHDECALAWNIKFKSYPEFFGVLNFMQMAPPCFMIISKFMTSVLGFSEYVMRLLPFFMGCSSIIAFYFLASKVLNKKTNIMLAVFFFSINPKLINFSFDFKPYSLDVFFAIMCLLFFINLASENSGSSDLSKISIKKAVFWGLIFALLPWFSFVSVFILAGGFLHLFFKNIKADWAKKIILSLPLVISCLIYLKVYLANNYTGSTGLFDFWQYYFVNGNIKQFIWLIANDMKYFFMPIKYLLFAFILLIWGVVVLYKEQSHFLKISSLSFGVLILASWLHLYPFAERLILFLLPIFLLLIIKPLDLVSFNKKVKSVVVIFLFLITFTPQILYAIELFEAKGLDKEEYPREMMEVMVKKLKATDTIFINNSSDAEFAYYSSFYGVKNKFIQEDADKNISKVQYIAKLNNLKPGYYWFYLPIDYIHVSVLPWIEEWAQKNKIIYYYKFHEKNKSLLIYMYVNQKKYW